MAMCTLFLLMMYCWGTRGYRWETREHPGAATLVPNPRSADCEYVIIKGFVQCVTVGISTNGTSQVLYKCPNSTQSYFIDKDDRFSSVCPRDTFNYQACGSDALIKSAMATLVCGYVVCKNQYERAFPMAINDDRFCNSTVYCSEVEIDNNDYCGTEKNDTFDCIEAPPLNNPLLKCDKMCDCKKYCDDETRCTYENHAAGCYYPYFFLSAPAMCTLQSNFSKEMEMKCTNRVSMCNETTNIDIDKTPRCKTWMRDGKGRHLELILNDKVRCFRQVMCEDKMDQTNCIGDTNRLECETTAGYRRIHEDIICPSNEYVDKNMGMIGDPKKAVCLDEIDNRCVALKCDDRGTIHKHFLCDGTEDCKVDKTDESVQNCPPDEMTGVMCRRRYRKDYSKKEIPVAWVGDGVVDCENGIDEIPALWTTCRYTVNGDTKEITTTECRDVFIYETATSWYMDTHYICNGVFSGEIASRMCSASEEIALLPTQVAGVAGVLRVSYCLPGLRELQYLTPFRCSESTVEVVEGGEGVLGASPYLVVEHPNGTVDCGFLYGEAYNIMACLGLCRNNSYGNWNGGSRDGATCRFDRKHSRHTAYNWVRSTTQYDYSVTMETGTLVPVRKVDSHIVVIPIFECNDKLTFLSPSQVCDLVKDCPEGEDEDDCINCMTVNRESLTWDKACDGKFDLENAADEYYCCDKDVIRGTPYKIACFLIGIPAVICNVVVIATSGFRLKRITSSTAFHNRFFIIIISLGDLLVGLYLLLIVSKSLEIGYRFCYYPTAEIEWLISSDCVTYGILCSFGSQISLFSMTLLSLTRVWSLLGSFSIPKPVAKRHVLKAVIVGVAIGFISMVLSVMPLTPQYKDVFVNALYYPDIPFFEQFISKETAMAKIERYYGRVRIAEGATSLTWDVIKRLVRSMFTIENGGYHAETLHFYGNDAVCLFKYFVSLDDPQRYYSWFVLAINGFCFIIMFLSYVFITAKSLRSSKTTADDQTSQGQNRQMAARNAKLQRKITIIIATDFLCWIPFIVTAALHTLEVNNATSLYALFSIVVLPINSFINPLLYDDFISKATANVWSKVKQGIPLKHIPKNQYPETEYATTSM